MHIIIPCAYNFYSKKDNDYLCNLLVVWYTTFFVNSFIALYTTYAVTVGGGVRCCHHDIFI